MRWLITGLVLIVFTPIASRGEMTFTPSPTDAWRYSFKPNSGIGSPAYVPTAADAVGAAFQGYLEDLPGWLGVAPYSQGSSFHVFETFLLSDIDLILPVLLGGDDGHTLFVDDVNVGGGGFGVNVHHNLEFVGNVPRKITIIGHNGPGNWTWFFQPKVANQPSNLGMSDAACLRMNADGDFDAVPEPTTLVLGSIGAALVGIHTVLRRRVRSRPRSALRGETHEWENGSCSSRLSED